MLKNKEIVIGKYLSGNASAAETKVLMDWIRASEQNKHEFDVAERLWKASGKLQKNNDYDVNTAWSQFQELKELSVPAKKSGISKLNWLRVAAAVMLLAVIGVLVKVLVLNAPLTEPTEVSVVKPMPADMTDANTEVFELDSAYLMDSTIQEPVQNTVVPRKTRFKKSQSLATTMVTIATDDSAKIFMLPDNSIVYLNSHSKLSFPENFVSSERTATLTGEAFFEVADGYKPFSVICDNTITGGYLSAFNIRNDERKDVEVIVVSGAAEFSGIGSKDFKKLNLKAGESGIYSKGEVIKAKHTRKNYKWWQRKNLRDRIKQLFERLRNTLR